MATSKLPPSPRDDVSRSSQSTAGGMGTRQVMFSLAASLIAGLSSYYSYFYASPATPARLTSLPSGYAVCTNGTKVYTVDERRPVVDCVLVHQSTVVATGTIDEIRSEWDTLQNELILNFYGNEPTAKKPLKELQVPDGHIVVPGLTDAHAHIVQYGFKMQLELDKATSLSQLLDMLEAHVKSHPGEYLNDAWLEATGWDQTRWSDWDGSNFPTAAHIAERPLLAPIPIALHRVDVHALWLSPRALELTLEAHGGSLPKSVPGGEIIRDPATGQPSGVLVDEAMALAPLPPASPAQRRAFAERAVADAVAHGLTSVHDASTSPDDLELFREMDAEGALPLRVYAMADSLAFAEVPGEVEQYDPDPGARVRMRSAKLFTDGALGSWGAALLAPYSDRPDTAGLIRFTEKELSEKVHKWWDKGWGVNIHAIGDRANKAVLDTFEAIAKDISGKTDSHGKRRDGKDEVKKSRPRIEHAQIMRPQDLKRAGELGVITSVQPTHATSDMSYAEKRLGPERIKGAYAYKTLLKNSPAGVLPLGSDFPVEGINPLLGFYAAVARLTPQGDSPHGPQGWNPQERLTRAEALKGMTLDAAYAAFAEDVLGSLARGKRADFVVLDRDIMREDVPAQDILRAKVAATVVDGRLVYGGI